MFGWLKRWFRPASGPRPSGAFRRLRVAARGDARMAERLIEYELKRAPGLSRDEAARRAIERLEYERTR